MLFLHHFIEKCFKYFFISKTERGKAKWTNFQFIEVLILYYNKIAPALEEIRTNSFMKQLYWTEINEVIIIFMKDYYEG